MEPVGEKTRGIASLRGKIDPVIGKWIGIMGGRIQFAPTIIRKILIQNPVCKPPKTKRGKILFILIPFKGNIQKINNLKLT